MKQKVILTLLYLSTLWLYTMAQDPGFNYQAVLRDSEGAPMPNATVTLIISLTDGPEGAVLYRESQSLTTNALGMLNTTVGAGSVESGQFADIIGIQNLNLKLEADIKGEPDIVDFGYSPISSTPYALYGEDADADPENEMQSLRLEGDSLKISGSNSIDLQTYQNHWSFDKDSNSYFLSFENGLNQRDDNKNGVQFKLKDGRIIRSEFVNNKEEAFFKIRDGRKIIDLPEVIQKTYQGIKIHLMEEFNINIDDSEADVGAEFTTRNGKIVKFAVGIKLNNERLTRIEIHKFPSFLTESVEVFFEDSERKINLNGYTDYFDPSKFDFFYGSQDVLGIKEFFINHKGKRKKVDPKLFNEQSYFEGTENETPAFALESNEMEGSTSMSIYSTKENDDCYHVLATPNGVSNTIYGNAASVVAQLYANDMAGFNLSGQDGCSSHGTCNSFLLVNSENGRSAPFSSALLSSNADKSGALVLSNQQSRNVQLTSLTDFPNNGYILVLDDQDQNKAGIFVDNTGAGVVYGSNINSIIQRDGANDAIVYGSLVGGESAAYDRGTATLVNGEATINCADHFQEIADPNSMTVTITPLSADSKGIAVVEKFPGGFKVKELGNGIGNYSIDYMVSCKRKGEENFMVRRRVGQPNHIEDLQSKTGEVSK